MEAEKCCAVIDRTTGSKAALVGLPTLKQTLRSAVIYLWSERKRSRLSFAVHFMCERCVEIRNQPTQRYRRITRSISDDLTTERAKDLIEELEAQKAARSSKSRRIRPPQPPAVSFIRRCPAACGPALASCWRYLHRYIPYRAIALSERA